MSSHLYCAEIIVTMNASNDVIIDGAILVEDKYIRAVGQFDALSREYPHVPVTKISDTLLMPGLVNTHCHSGLLRGTAEGLPVWEWLQRYIDPMHRVITPGEAALASQLCYAEALLSGTTTIVDMWRYMEGSALAAQALGIRALLVPYVAEHPDHDYFETLESNERLIKAWHQTQTDRISVWVGLEHMFYAVPQAMGRIKDLCRHYQVGFHTHSNESRFDVEETFARHGARPIQVLEKLGLLSASSTLLAHCVWLDDAEIQLLSDHNIGVAHNPVSNMKLASGAARVQDMLDKGIAVGLGTDGEKENNNLDMFEELKTASLLAKHSAADASALDAWSICRMATIEGARALGMQDSIGSLEVGKRADMIAVRTNTPRMTPLITTGKHMNLPHNLVHAVQGGDIAMTMVDGKLLVEDGKLRQTDLPGIIHKANAAIGPLLARRDEWLKQTGLGVNELNRS
ncbi:MAG: 5-methylthioadenosine/S-adenosylhomocysteine deaminase [Candidatus Pseudothioglobus sp.]|jgi:5-methylthioadenosine/S-adenosylhomocysteine deaminase